MSPEPLLADLQRQSAALKHSSEQLALLADYLPKHGATVRSLSRTLLSGSQFIDSMTAHIQRDADAA